MFVHVMINDVVYFLCKLAANVITLSWVETTTAPSSYDEYYTDVDSHGFTTVGNY